MTKSVYDIIKKQNGEGFARVLRNKGLLDIPDIAHIVKYAGHTATDADKIFPYLWSLKVFKEETATINVDPFQLLDQAGYHAFEVHNLDEQNSIRHFFRKNEELCTFRDYERYQDNYMIHAIRHDVWRDPYAIKPSDKPTRQDEYGTSVISIQIRKNGGFISIKNRYNHSVDHPDQTFNSNPDEIIAGLSGALKAYFNVDWKSTSSVPSGFIVMNNQILKINIEHNNNYVGDGFYTKNGQIIDVDKSSQIQMDYFIWDNNTRQLLNPLMHEDGFYPAFMEQAGNKKITVSGKYPNQTIMVDGVKIIELTNGEITSLNFPDATYIDDMFLMFNKSLKSISLPRVTEIGGMFLYQNTALTEISLPSVTKIDSSFLRTNTGLKHISVPKLKSVRHAFLHDCHDLEEIDAPELETIGRNFLYRNNKLEKISLPNVTSIGEHFLGQNKSLREIDLPQVRNIDMGFLLQNNSLTEISLPSAVMIDDFFMDHNTVLHSISLPKVTHIGCSFLQKNVCVKRISLPFIQKIGAYFMQDNKHIHKSQPPQQKKHADDISVPTITKNKNRDTIAKRFKHAIQKFYNYVRMTYRANSDYEI